MAEKETRNVTFRDFIETARNSFLSLSQDIYPPFPPRCSLALYPAFHLLLMLLTVGSYPVLVYLKGLDIIEGMASFLLLITQIGSLVKVLIAYFKRDKLFSTLRQLEERFPKEPQHSQIPAKFTGDLKFIRFWVTQSFATLVLLLFVPIVLMVYTYFRAGVIIYILPMKAFYPFNTDDWYVFVPTFLFQIVGGIYTTIGFIGFDMIIASIILLTCVQFETLRTDIERFDEDQLSVSKLVDDHQSILDIVDSINDLFSGYVLFTFTIDTAQICVNLFVVLIAGMKLSIGETIPFVFSAIASTGHKLVVCYFSNLLTEHSLTIPNAIWSSLWYSKDVNHQKSVQLMLARAQQPSYLRASKFFNITLATFTTVISRSYSYFTILKIAYSGN